MTYLAPLMLNRDRKIRRSLYEAMVVIIAGCFAGVLSNTFSSRSIPLLGEWNKAYGVPSPGGAHASTHGNIEIHLSDAQRLLLEGALFVDARPREAFLEDHIPGARSVTEDTLPDRLSEISEGVAQGKKVVVYCQGMDCDESHIIAAKLREGGIGNVCVFAGGLGEWKAAGSSLEKGEEQK
ncbi:MAG: rhodanese-like domain-containing protein [Candidatus Aureabacteria bacterium]|nr:rhodanese-like domain-containing protein [Candidatus Auribacterota bacterium]